MRNLNRNLLLATLCAMVAGTVAAQQRTVVRAARMLDVESGRIVPNAVVVVEGEKIVAVNPAQPPAGAQTIDLGDVTLLPGLLDMHTHLTFDLDKDFFLRAVTEGPVDEALRGAANARKTLLAGFTTVRNVGSGGFSDVALMRAIDAGLLEGPRIFPAAHALSITGGHCDTTGFAPGILEGSPREGTADGVDEVVQAVRYQIKHGAKVIKTCATAGVLSSEGPVGAQQYSDEELRAMVEEARRHGVKVAAHGHGGEGILAAVRAGVASVEHSSTLTDETIRLMIEKGTYIVPTAHLLVALDTSKLPPVNRAKAEYIFPIAKESHRKAIRAGVKYAFGTDVPVIPHGSNGGEFGTLVSLGMTPIQALRSATANAADLLGVSDRGTLAAGKLADMVAVPGNPLENVRVMEDVRFVMKGGKVYKRP